jgi:hypothetical protein
MIALGYPLRYLSKCLVMVQEEVSEQTSSETARKVVGAENQR